LIIKHIVDNYNIDKQINKEFILEVVLIVLCPKLIYILELAKGTNNLTEDLFYHYKRKA